MLAMSTALAATASARDGFYVAARGGLTNGNMNSVDAGTTSTADVDFDNVWMMSGAVGYRYSYFRAELEYVYHEDHEEEVAPGAGTEFSNTNYMLNGYIDLMPNYIVSPYLSAGIGYSNVQQTTTSTIGTATISREYDSDNLTWSLGGGVTVRVNQCLNVDAGYRYMDMGDIDNANVNAHEWYFGLRYTF